LPARSDQTNYSASLVVFIDRPRAGPEDSNCGAATGGDTDAAGSFSNCKGTVPT
jgi:hypothetical protein